MSDTPPEPHSTPELQFNLPDNNQNFDPALRLIPSPLLPAARAAAQHPFPVEDLHEDIGFCFNSDITAADFDDFLDTQYVQLNPTDDITLAPTTAAPQPPPSVSTTHTLCAPPPPQLQPQPPPPPKLADPSPRQGLSPKRTRASPPKPSPIPIAPRGQQQQEQKQQKQQNPHPHPHPHPQQPQQLPQKRKPQQFESRGAARLAERRNPADVSPEQSLSMGPATVSLPPHMAQGMIPLLNMASMYPLQHHPATFLAAGKGPPASASGISDSKKMCVEPPTTMPMPQLLPARVPFLTPGVVPYDPGLVSLFQMTPQMYAQFAAAATAAAYQTQHPLAIPLGEQNQTNVPSGVLHHAPTVPSVTEAGRTVSTALEGNAGAAAASAVTVSAGFVPLSPACSLAMQSNRPVIKGEDGAKVALPKQSLAKLERNVVLGRLELQNESSGAMGKMTESGKSSVCMTDTQAVSGSSKDRLGGAVKIRRSGSVASVGKTGASWEGGSSGLQEGEQTRAQKKRLVWTPELHERFIQAINAVGLHQAVPKTLVTIMNVEGLTTEHVKSHLQKYRNSLRKEAVEEQRERNGKAGASASKVGAVGLRTNADGGGGQYAMVGNRMSVYGGDVGGEGSAVGGAGMKGVVGLSAGGKEMFDGGDVRQELNGGGSEGEEARDVVMDGGVVGVEQKSTGMMGNIDGTRGGGGEAVIAGGAKSGGGMGAGGDGGVGGEEREQWGKGGAEDVVGADKIAGERWGDKEGDEGMKRVGDGTARNVGEGSKGRRIDKALRLELMDEKTLQMQLTLQMMVHRTIVLEKRLEQESTDKMQAEDSVAASGRSGRCDDKGGGNRGDAEMGDGGRGEVVGGKEVGDGGMSSKCAVAELLKGQLEIGAALEQTRAMISEMREHATKCEKDRGLRDAEKRDEGGGWLEARGDDEGDNRLGGDGGEEGGVGMRSEVP